MKHWLIRDFEWKYCLQRHLENPPETVYLSKDDSNERLVSEMVYFFIDTGWVRRNINGTYAFTTM